VIVRHPSGGRKDILRWASMSERASAELEIYRPGVEFAPAANRECRARAELKRSSCRPLSADWITGAENPRLRGLL
jgi:hypothetical protein